MFELQGCSTATNAQTDVPSSVSSVRPQYENSWTAVTRINRMEGQRTELKETPSNYKFLPLVFAWGL